jgi:2-keto-4-pentenoate hydratase/2-oxohepta-3-ene-1,7-dioic acid hydratase in catechol pathway
MGPALVTADEIANPNNLKISLTINGETLQNSNTDKLIFNVQQLVESISEVMTLEPGDVVSTGTPPGVGMARNPKRFMKAGDVVNVTIEGLGTLSNPVVAE